MFPSDRRRSAVKEGARFFLFAPLIGNLIISLVLMIEWEGSLGLGAMFKTFLGLFLLGMFVGYVVAGIPAFVTGLFLYGLNCQRSTRLLLAPFVGFFSMCLWWLFWMSVNGKELTSAFLYGGVAAASAAALVAYELRNRR